MSSASDSNDTAKALASPDFCSPLLLTAYCSLSTDKRGCVWILETSYALCEKEGQLKRIKAEVDWDLEISHVAKLVEEKSGPALLFENVKGYKSPVLTGAFGTTQRLAMILGKSPKLSMVELTKEWVNVAVKEVIRAKEVNDGPIFENIVEGDKIDTFAFPSPKFYELDGGRYFGTAVFMVLAGPRDG